ncbi:MAG: bifunctional heptose 7-phosphate kinase/heptose 1-phosphate adenyltransferase [Hyphomicrobiales bacterium]
MSPRPAPPDRARLLALARAIAGRTVAVIGDLVLDRYWVGRSSRISREAPVLILDFEEERRVPGGAANAAMNLRAMGGKVRLVGRIGIDPAGKDLRRSLRAHGVASDWLARDRAMETIVKTRILAGSSHASRQQIVRLDRGHRAPLPGPAERQLVRAASRAIRGADAVLLSDYGYGALGPAVRRAALAAARGRRRPIVVDSRYALRSYRGASLLTPNEHELAEAYHLPSLEPGALRRAGEALRRAAAADGVWITRGSDGMMLVTRGAPTLRLPIVGSSDVADVTGAGDAVSAAAALALAAGATQLEAAVLATYAASVVVMKRGTATVDAAELREAIEAHPAPKAR